MHIEHLEECVDLGHTLSFTKTARNFFTSQPVLSRHVSNLEAELGFEVFARNQRGVFVTEEGRAFLADAEKVVEDYRKMMANVELRRRGLAGTLTVGFLEGVAMPHISRAHLLFSMKMLDIELRYMTCEYRDSLPALDAGLVDMVITGTAEDFPIGKYNHRLLFEDHYCAAFSKDHPLAGRKSVSLPDLRGETVVTSSTASYSSAAAAIKRYLKEKGSGIHISESIHDAKTLSILLDSENCVCITVGHLAGYYGENDYALVPLEDCEDRMPYYIIWNKGRRDEDVCRAYADAFVTAFNENTANSPSASPQTLSRPNDYDPVRCGEKVIPFAASDGVAIFARSTELR